MSRNIIGTKYQEAIYLSNKEIAKLIRQDLKNAQKEKKIPECIKFSVVSSSISLNIRAVGGLDDIKIFTNEYIQSRKNGGYSYNGFTKKWQKISNRVNEILRRYNYTYSDMPGEYANKNFYGNFEIDFSYVNKLIANAIQKLGS